VSLTPIAKRYDRFILDLDGCVWVGDEPTPRAVEAIDSLREAGKDVVYATNDPRSATEDYVARLWKIGVRASMRDVVTAGGALQHLLAETRTGRTAFVVGTDALRKHVTEAGLRVLNGTDLASRAEVVVVGGTEDLVYDDLRFAALAVRRGADFLATARDATYPQPDGLWPGTGAILAAIEVASGQKAQTVGKPEPQLMLTALDRFGTDDGRTLVVGDRIDTDLAAAAAANLDAALVLSGGTERQALNGFEPEPVAVTDTLGDLILG
jgi:HAD superfamily hydrolase (TIGR01450 family)